MNKVQVSKPYIFNITNTNAPQPVVLFDIANSEGESVSNLIGSQSYADIKIGFSENPVLIGRIRIDFGNSIIEEIAIGFRRTINGEVFEKKFIAPYFLAMNQFISTAVEISIQDLPLDGKTEILVYNPNDQPVRLMLYPCDPFDGLSTEKYDELFLKAVNSGWFYDDCIEVSNPTDAIQNAVLNFTEDGVCCENKSLKVSSSEKYLPDDAIYFRKVFSNKNIPALITNGEHGVHGINIHLAVNSFQTSVVDIMGRQEVNKEKVISFTLAPFSNFCLFVLKNKKPLYDNRIYVNNYASIDFNSASEVRAVLADINKQKVALELLLEKNDFVIKD